jgi:hypothetical protein
LGESIGPPSTTGTYYHFVLVLVGILAVGLATACSGGGAKPPAGWTKVDFDRIELFVPRTWTVERATPYLAQCSKTLPAGEPIVLLFEAPQGPGPNCSGAPSHNEVSLASCDPTGDLGNATTIPIARGRLVVPETGHVQGYIPQWHLALSSFVASPNPDIAKALRTIHPHSGNGRAKNSCGP